MSIDWKRYPKVQFRPGAVPGLSARVSSREDLTSTAIRDLTRYYAVLEHSRPALSQGEWMLLFDVLNGTMLDEQIAPYLWAEVTDAYDEDRDLAEKWGVAVPSLIDKLRRMSFAEQMAVCDLVERFWALPSDMDHREQMERLGIG
jgi:hypothetical protein